MCDRYEKIPCKKVREVLFMDKKEKSTSTSHGGMYRGVDVPIKLLDFIIIAGIAILGVLMFL